jgi:hypothetical protein
VEGEVGWRSDVPVKDKFQIIFRVAQLLQQKGAAVAAALGTVGGTPDKNAVMEEHLNDFSRMFGILLSAVELESGDGMLISVFITQLFAVFPCFGMNLRTDSGDDQLTRVTEPTPGPPPDEVASSLKKILSSAAVQAERVIAEQNILQEVIDKVKISMNTARISESDVTHSFVGDEGDIDSLKELIVVLEDVNARAAKISAYTADFTERLHISDRSAPNDLIPETTGCEQNELTSSTRQYAELLKLVAAAKIVASDALACSSSTCRGNVCELHASELVDELSNSAKCCLENRDEVTTNGVPASTLCSSLRLLLQTAKLAAADAESLVKGSSTDSYTQDANTTKNSGSDARQLQKLLRIANTVAGDAQSLLYNSSLANFPTALPAVVPIVVSTAAEPRMDRTEPSGPLVDLSRSIQRGSSALAAARAISFNAVNLASTYRGKDAGGDQVAAELSTDGEVMHGRDSDLVELQRSIERGHSMLTDLGSVVSNRVGVARKYDSRDVNAFALAAAMSDIKCAIDAANEALAAGQQVLGEKLEEDSKLPPCRAGSKHRNAFTEIDRVQQQRSSDAPEDGCVSHLPVGRGTDVNLFRAESYVSADSGNGEFEGSSADGNNSVQYATWRSTSSARDVSTPGDPVNILSSSNCGGEGAISKLEQAIIAARDIYSNIASTTYSAGVGDEAAIPLRRQHTRDQSVNHDAMYSLEAQICLAKQIQARTTSIKPQAALHNTPETLLLLGELHRLTTAAKITADNAVQVLASGM